MVNLKARQSEEVIRTPNISHFANVTEVRGVDLSFAPDGHKPLMSVCFGTGREFSRAVARTLSLT